MALNVTTAVFAENCNTATASPSLAQWDTEQVLQISGIDLPDSYKVEFSTVCTRNAIPAIGDASGVAIPNVLLQRSAPITAYIVLYGENGGRNREYWITIYITPGQPPETITPDPEQADVIDEAIAALNNGVARTEAAATSAEGSARDAEAAAEAVQNLSVAAETLATGEPATVEKAVDPETGAVTLNFGLPRGAKGDPLTYEELTPEQKAELVQGPILEAQNASVTAVRNARASAVDAVESAGTTQVNAVNQAGTTQTGAVNQAGANQVAAVNQAGTNQVQAMEDKGAEVLDSIPPDYSDLADDVADLSRQLNDETTGLDTKAPVIINTASGAIASFSDGANGMPIRKLVAQIEPVQDLHGYDSPWPAGGGRNLLDWAKASVIATQHYGMTFSKGTEEGTVIVSGTLQTSGGAVSVINYSDYSLSGKGYVFLTEHISGDHVIDLTRTYGFRTEDEPSIALYLTGTVGQSYSETIRVSVYAPPVPSAWSPYENICPISGHTGAEIYHEAEYDADANPTISVNWETEAGTVYGGREEIIKGELESVYGVIDLGDLIYTKTQSGLFAFSRLPNSLDSLELGKVGDAISDLYKFVASSPITGNNPNYYYCFAISAGGTLYVSDPRYTDVTEFKTAMSGRKIIYKLATPQEYTFTENEMTTLYGTNNIWASTGDTSVEYCADTKLYIDGKIAELQATILENIGG